MSDLIKQKQWFIDALLMEAEGLKIHNRATELRGGNDFYNYDAFSEIAKEIRKIASQSDSEFYNEYLTVKQPKEL